MLKDYQEKAFKQSLKRLNSTERQLAQIYKSSLSELKSKLLILSEKIDNKIMTDSDLFKYNRLSKMYENTMLEMKKISSETYNVIFKSNRDIAKLVYNGSRTGYKEETTKGIDIGRINADSLKQMVEFSYPEVPFRDFVKKLGANGVARLKQTMGAGFAQGESIPNLANRIKVELNKTFNDAVRIARTEGLRANSEAQVEATGEAEKLGIKIKKIWQSTNDDRTRPDHAGMDGVSADEDGLFWINGDSAIAPRLFNGVDSASQNINCRCSYIEEIIEEK